MVNRNPGENPMLENQIESNTSIDRRKRYSQILEVMKDQEMTFREIARAMFDKGYTIGTETTYSQPRVTEMVRKGMIEPVGTKVSDVSGKKVTVFRVRDNAKSSVCTL